MSALAWELEAPSAYLSGQQKGLMKQRSWPMVVVGWWGGMDWGEVECGPGWLTDRFSMERECQEGMNRKRREGWDEKGGVE